MGQDDSRAMQDPLVNESEQPAPGSHDYRSPQFSSHEYTTNDYAGIGFVWSQPSATSKTVYHRDEYVAETFYTLQLSPMSRLQPTNATS